MILPRTKSRPAIKPNTVELTELLLARSIGVFALLLIALALPDLLQGAGSKTQLDYMVFVVLIPVLTIATMIPRKHAGLRRLFAGTVAWMILLGFLLWHLGLIGNGLSPDARPWSWGIAGAGVGLAAVAKDIKMANIYGLVFSMLILAVPLLPAGYGRHWSDSWQDALLTVAMTTVIVAPIWALRGAVLESDQAAVDAVEKFVEAARSEAISLERHRLDALTHDIILSTLIVASQARTQEVVEAARRAAVAALAQLETVKHDAGTSSADHLTTREWLGRLGDAVGSLGMQVEVPKPVPGGRREIPLLVARALTQAAMEAVRNAAEHAPGAALQVGVQFPGRHPRRGAAHPRPGAVPTATVTDLEIDLETDLGNEQESEHGIVVVDVSDDGPGFDVGTVPLERMGVRLSIVERMCQVGGSAEISSRPGGGTLVRLQWPREGGARGQGD
ncbi:sensor histidine kinase [Arthrobacter sp.]|uniref:sensor histidine kinase n=1 Tax=Arthrobacter sp. TaxID=1667 RepID=UPI0026E0F5CA|nr:ATP-binding protein [Arthrobacter sp.]MDO5752477.1 ATP-binding protein [Arthrobacter sp.]